MSTLVGEFEGCRRTGLTGFAVCWSGRVAQIATRIDYLEHDWSKRRRGWSMAGEEDGRRFGLLLPRVRS